MKKPGFLAASVAAASATAISGSNSTIQISREGGSSNNGRDETSSEKSSSSEKFAPRFDGLRFIETLVTAHR